MLDILQNSATLVSIECHLALIYHDVTAFFKVRVCLGLIRELKETFSTFLKGICTRFSQWAVQQDLLESCIGTDSIFIDL